MMHGVVCDSGGRVTELVLVENGLEGSIPDRFYELQHLQLLVLQGNVGLVGTISEAIGQLTQLKRVYLGENSLEGPIPAKLGKLTRVVTL